LIGLGDTGFNEKPGSANYDREMKVQARLQKLSRSGQICRTSPRRKLCQFGNTPEGRRAMEISVEDEAKFIDFENSADVDREGASIHRSVLTRPTRFAAPFVKIELPRV
jgi:hypothetical protein